MASLWSGMEPMLLLCSAVAELLVDAITTIAPLLGGLAIAPSIGAVRSVEELCPTGQRIFRSTSGRNPAVSRIAERARKSCPSCGEAIEEGVHPITSVIPSPEMRTKKATTWVHTSCVVEKSLMVAKGKRSPQGGPNTAEVVKVEGYSPQDDHEGEEGSPLGEGSEAGTPQEGSPDRTDTGSGEGQPSVEQLSQRLEELKAAMGDSENPITASIEDDVANMIEKAMLEEQLAKAEAEGSASQEALDSLEAEQEARLEELKKEMEERLESIEDAQEAEPEPFVISPLEEIEESLEIGLTHEALPLILTLCRTFTDAHRVGSAEAVRRQAVLMYGPAGSGKTTIADSIHEILHHLSPEAGGFIGETFYPNSVVFPCSEEMLPADLVGTKVPALTGDEAGSEKFTPSAILNCFANGGVVVLDEFDALNHATLISMNAMLAGSHISHPQTGERISRHRDFVCLAAGNTAGDGGTSMYLREAQDFASLDRFFRIPVDYSVSIETVILGGNRQMNSLRERLWLARQNIEEAGVNRLISTRDFVKCRVMLDQTPFDENTILSLLFATWDDDALASAGEPLSGVVPFEGKAADHRRIENTLRAAAPPKPKTGSEAAIEVAERLTAFDSQNETDDEVGGDADAGGAA